jgi:hypothetical protein
MRDSISSVTVCWIKTRFLQLYYGLQFCVSCVGAILVIAHTPRVKTSFVPTEKKVARK